jgi:CheY-like chemotaxis protein
MHIEFIDQHTRPTVLLAEDDPDQSDMLRDALQDGGYMVDCAFSGDIAYQKLLAHQYDLIIMDIRMPGLNGGTVLKAFRKLRPEEPRTPVIVVSAFATGADIARYKADGADASFAKPYSLDELLNSINDFIRQKRGAKC